MAIDITGLRLRLVRLPFFDLPNAPLPSYSSLPSRSSYTNSYCSTGRRNVSTRAASNMCRLRFTPLYPTFVRREISET